MTCEECSMSFNISFEPHLGIALLHSYEKLLRQFKSAAIFTIIAVFLDCMTVSRLSTADFVSVYCKIKGIFHLWAVCYIFWTYLLNIARKNVDFDFNVSTLSLLLLFRANMITELNWNKWAGTYCCAGITGSCLSCALWQCNL